MKIFTVITQHYGDGDAQNSSYMFKNFLTLEKAKEYINGNVKGQQYIESISDDKVEVYGKESNTHYGMSYIYNVRWVNAGEILYGVKVDNKFRDRIYTTNRFVIENDVEE